MPSTIPPKRPAITDDEVLDLASHAFVAAVPKKDLPENVSEEEITDNVFDAFLKQTTFDRCLFLYQQGWAITDEVLALVQSFEKLRTKAVETMERAWVVEHAVRFPASEGQRVKFADPQTGFEKQGIVRGVTKIAARGLVEVRTFHNGEEGAEVIWVPAERVRAILHKDKAIQIVRSVRETTGSSNNALFGDPTNLVAFPDLLATA